MVALNPGDIRQVFGKKVKILDLEQEIWMVEEREDRCSLRTI
jgi:hypothetical protein